MTVKTTAGPVQLSRPKLRGTESADAWHDFLTDLKDRGLPSPLLIRPSPVPGSSS